MSPTDVLVDETLGWLKQERGWQGLGGVKGKWVRGKKPRARRQDEE